MSKSGALHESYSREEAIEGSSDRGFGFVFSAVFALISAYQWWYGGMRWAWWLGAAVLILAIALVWPRLLSGPNRWWTKFGLLLFRFISPIMMGVIFYGTMWPINRLLRLTGKVILPVAFDRDAKSYWVHRSPGEPSPESMKRQF